MNQETIQAKVQAAIKRRKAEQTVPELAKALGVSVPTMHRLARGERIDRITQAVVALLIDDQRSAA
jgi:hypothetical protein